MKKTLLSAAIVATSLIALAPAAQAADGTIDFTGSVVGTTCEIRGNGGGSDFTVALPPVSTTSLASAGSWAGRTKFDIKLSNCSPQTGLVQTYFEPGPTVNQNTGRLIVDQGGATNVEIGLLNDTFGKIKAGAAVASQNSQTVNIAGGNANMSYYAQYESLGGAKAGAANSRVQYTMSYQ
ncbi:fimbrial protein [Burkholderia sp. BE17]|nr:fimbrial protein [Burkholderia sp. BE17]